MASCIQQDLAAGRLAILLMGATSDAILSYSKSREFPSRHPYRVEFGATLSCERVGSYGLPT
jgi:hypothetical protein